MPIIYDLKTDIRYLQGVEENKFDTVKRLLNLGYTDIKEIAVIANVGETEVERVKKDMELDTNSSDNQSA